MHPGHDGPRRATAHVFAGQHTGEVTAARFVGDRPRIEVLDPHFAEVYAELEKLSGGVLGTLSSDESEQRWAATFIHDREPAVTWFYDHGTGESRLLFRPYPRLDPAELAPMTAIHFPARDRLPLHAFLMLPVGIEPRDLRLVLLVIDAADWAVQRGYADPARIGIFGGYAPGTRRAPERRRCLVQLAGLDRHRTSPQSGNAIALSQTINRKCQHPRVGGASDG